MTNYNVELWMQETPDSEMSLYPVDIFQFPGGELQVKDINHLPSEVYKASVFFRGAAPETIIAAALVIDTMVTIKIQHFEIVAPYLPAARSDRGRVAAIQPYYEMLTHTAPGLTSNTFVTLDVHNMLAYPISDSYRYKSYQAVDMYSLPRFDNLHIYDGVLAPDAGAVSRAATIANDLRVPLFQATKERDFNTGKLLAFHAPEGLIEQGTYLVVDDIMDGGGTFAGLISQIDEKYPNNLMAFDLWVTHGIFSGNWNKNLEDFREVYTTNSHPGTDKLDRHEFNVFDVRELLIRKAD